MEERPVEKTAVMAKREVNMMVLLYCTNERISTACPPTVGKQTNQPEAAASREMTDPSPHRPSQSKKESVVYVD